MTMATPNKPGHPARTLVFVHGYLDGPEVWKPLLDQLVLPGWQIVNCRLQANFAPQATTNAAATLEHYARQVLDQVGISRQAEDMSQEDRFIFVGHSMGAQIAELAALEVGQHLSALVRITPAPLAGYPLPAEVMARFASRAVLADPDAIGAGKQAMAKALDGGGVDILVRATLATGPAAALEQLHAWTGGHPAGNVPSAIDAPVLTIATDDAFFTADMLENGAKRFSRRTFEHVPGAGHWPQLEQPCALARAIERFVRVLA